MESKRVGNAFYIQSYFSLQSFNFFHLIQNMGDTLICVYKGTHFKNIFASGYNMAQQGTGFNLRIHSFNG